MESWARQFFDLSTQPQAVMDPDGRFLQLNAAWRSVVGWTPEQLQSEGCWRFVHPEDLGHVKSRLRALGEGHPGADFHCRWRCADDAWKVMSWSVVSPVAGGPLYCSLRLQESSYAEAALQRTEESFRKLIENMPDGIFIYREDRRFIYLNATMTTSLGYERPEELLGQSIMDIVHPDSLTRVRERQANIAVNGTNALAEIRMLRRDGTSYDTETTSLTIEFEGRRAVAVVVRDITERKRLQERLLQSDRMAMVGTLAAGVGHEINNPLSYILTNTRLALENIQALRQPGALEAHAEDLAEALQETQEMLQEAHEGGLRVRDIVRDLKLFSRQEEKKKTQVDVTKPLEFSLKMAMGELRHRARLVKRFEPVPLVLADESRLSQVFLNLLMNAAQALPEGGADHHEVCVWVRPGLSGGVAVDVSDTGAGIAPEVLGRIFEPFFTTKPVGMGTGLGLSICQGIVREFGGELTVRSRLGHGSTFTLSLPAIPAGRTVDLPHAPSRLMPALNKGRIMVVDDEVAVARSLARLIGPTHHVMLVRTGHEALERLAGPEDFDAIICDVTLTDTSGMDVYERALEVRPALARRFIFMSGGVSSPRARQFLESMPARWLEKPFDERRLRRLLDEVLRAS